MRSVVFFGVPSSSSTSSWSMPLAGRPPGPGFPTGTDPATGRADVTSAGAGCWLVEIDVGRERLLDRFRGDGRRRDAVIVADVESRAALQPPLPDVGLLRFLGLGDRGVVPGILARAPGLEVVELFLHGAAADGILLPLELGFEVLLALGPGRAGHAHARGGLVAGGAVAAAVELELDQLRLHLQLGDERLVARAERGAIVLESGRVARESRVAWTCRGRRPRHPRRPAWRA